MDNTIHGHRVLEHLLAQPAPLPVADLRSWAAATHGPDARYFTCSAQDMTFDGLLQFLTSRAKVSVEGGFIRSGSSPMCGGDHDHAHPHDGEHDHAHPHDGPHDHAH